MTSIMDMDGEVSTNQHLLIADPCIKVPLFNQAMGTKHGTLHCTIPLNKKHKLEQIRSGIQILFAIGNRHMICKE